MTTPQDYVRLGAEQQAKLLRSILERCKTDGSAARPALVFDLDGTLLENRPRTLAILREFAADLKTRSEISAEAAAAADRLLAAKADELLYLVGHSLEALGIRAQHLIAEASDFWKSRFFIDDYLQHDVEVRGAATFTRACYESGANIIYFTGRDVPNMSLGSFKSLRDLGFPIGVPGTSLVCKPYFDMPDEEYKREVGPELARMGKIVAVFDNEPINCNNLLKMYDGVESVFLDTQHLPGAPPLDPRVHVLADFAM